MFPPCLSVPSVCDVLSGRYFEDDDNDQKTLSELEYLPAPGSPTLDRMNAVTANQKDDDSSSSSSDDPLESFMADIEARRFDIGCHVFLVDIDVVTVAANAPFVVSALCHSVSAQVQRSLAVIFYFTK